MIDGSTIKVDPMALDHSGHCVKGQRAIHLNNCVKDHELRWMDWWKCIPRIFNPAVKNRLIFLAFGIVFLSLAVVNNIMKH